MSLNNIELPAYTVAELYGHTLVSGNKAVQETLKPATAKDGEWKYLGSNQKNVLVLVSHSGVAHLPDSDLSFLTGILTASKLSLADVAILNLDNYPNAGYDQLTSELKSKTVLLFGISPALLHLPMNFPQYQVQAFNGVTYLHAPALIELENDKSEKMKLWACLKKIFEL